MSSKDAHLYGDKPKTRAKGKEISVSNSLAFSTKLSSLIKSASENQGKPAAGRGPPQKEDIFTRHHKNGKKRPLKDAEDLDFAQKHRARTAEEKGEDDETYRRIKRRMEEKARLYDALHRGDIEDKDNKYGVDFDRKWAEKQEHGEPQSASESESEASEEDLVEYVDLFGRTRTGTRAAAAREERQKRRLAADEPDRFSARPAMPDNIIYGDIVQTNAFNPDDKTVQAMAALAAKRDKEPTPPPDVHFDGRAEVRQYGTGFMHFSKDADERREQMQSLERERDETVRVRREQQTDRENKEMLTEEKKKAVREKKVEHLANRFLNELGVELAQKNEEPNDVALSTVEKKRKLVAEKKRAVREKMAEQEANRFLDDMGAELAQKNVEDDDVALGKAEK